MSSPNVRAPKPVRSIGAGAGPAAGPLAGCHLRSYSISKGLQTRAGSRINRSHAPARDATLITPGSAGAVLVGALNMGEYAYDFTGENVHDGPSRNPHDLPA